MVEKNQSKKVGQPPGSFIFTGRKRVEETIIHCIVFDEHEVVETTNIDSSTIEIPSPQPDKILWCDVRGVHNTELIEYLTHVFSLHPLVGEDILNTRQVPKIEDYDNGIFLVLRAFDSLQNDEILDEQIAIFIGKNFVLSFQEDKYDQFRFIRARIHENKGRVRHKKEDYLGYLLADYLVDNYLLNIENLGNQLDELENQILRNPVAQNKRKLYDIKAQILKIRKSAVPLNEGMSRFSRRESHLFDPTTLVYIRDLYDHTRQVLEQTNYFRETIFNLQETYSAEIALRTNHVMRVLTIISSIFIPLTFIAGVYGMNFENMPELKWHYGYYACLGLMFLVFIGSLIYFRVKRWL